MVLKAAKRFLNIEGISGADVFNTSEEGSSQSHGTI